MWLHKEEREALGMEGKECAKLEVEPVRHIREPPCLTGVGGVTEAR